MPVEQYIWVGDRWRNGAGIDAELDFILGTTIPTASNTGCAPGILTSNTYYTGSATITASGTVIENCIIDKDLDIRTSNVTIRNCYFIGGTDGASTSMIKATNAGCFNLQVSRVTANPRVKSDVRNFLVGHDYTAIRCDVSGVVDAFRVHNTNVGTADVDVAIKLQGNYIHDATFYYPATGQSDGTHNDGVQIENGRNIEITGNSIHAFIDPNVGQAQDPSSPWYPSQRTLSCIIVTPNVGPCADITIDKNWFYGGRWPVNLSEGGRGAVVNFLMTGNRFAGDQTYTPTSIRQATYDLNFSSWVGNLNTATGQPVIFTRQAGV